MTQFEIRMVINTPETFEYIRDILRAIPSFNLEEINFIRSSPVIEYRGVTSYGGTGSWYMGYSPIYPENSISYMENESTG